jgi:hypothetical protein
MNKKKIEVPIEKPEKLKDCTLLVLCKSELFYQTADGKTITTDYPVSKTSASVTSLLLGIPLSYDGGPEVDNEKVLKDTFK